MEDTVTALNLMLSEHTIYIRQNIAYTKKNSDDIDDLKEDLRANKALNLRTAMASEETSRDTKELVALFKGSKNIVVTGKYISITATYVSLALASLLAIWHFGLELFNIIVAYFRGR